MTNLRHVLLGFLLPVVLSQTSKPHIVVILMDDLGWNDVGYHGSDQIRTPNIDALAYSGMVMTRHYVMPTCTPSRTALLTGFHPTRTGMHGFPLKGGENRSLPLSFKLKPQWLRELGYRTHMVGKWHLGYETYNHVPNHRGFDSFFGYYNGYFDYYRYDYNQSLTSLTSRLGDTIFRGYDLHSDDDIYYPEEPRYATTLFADRAVNIIQDHDPSEPLYLYLSHVAVHTGADDPGELQVPEDANVNETYPHIRHYGRRALAGCLEELDKSVGSVVAALKRKNMLENSVLLVMSDNGGHTVSVDMPPNWSSNWPLAGTKFTMFEGGIRGTAVVWSPFMPKGFINYGFMHISDWLPTLYSAAGGNVKDLGDIDGRNQWEALKQGTTVKRDTLLVNINEKTESEGVIINNRWKVLKGGFPNYGNYDLHWGEDDNVAPNPPYNITAVLTSPAGTAVQSLPEFGDLLKPKRMMEMRGKAMVRCNLPLRGLYHADGGIVPDSSSYTCPDFCVFDILEDPCELNNLKNEEVLEAAKKYLEGYKKRLIPQKPSAVDVRSNPRLFGGAWMPWRVEECAKNVAEEFTSKYLNLSLFITMTLYSLRNSRWNWVS